MNVQEQSTRRPTHGYAVKHPGAPFEPFAFDRRALLENDVAVRITHCGICHTDLHYRNADSSWNANFPLVPGHEIAGVATEVGSAVSDIRPGDVVMVGTIVDSCGRCDRCMRGLEQACIEFPTVTFNGRDRHDGSITRGGYSREYVADARFVYKLPEGMDPAKAAPLLCAGITTYSPLKHWNVGPGTRVGIAGIGGLGHLAIKFARALGAEVFAFTTSKKKHDEALALGAHHAILSTDPAQMRAVAGRLSFILDTIPADHSLDPYLETLDYDGVLCEVGMPDRLDMTPLLLTLGRRSVSSSGVGGTPETREMLAFANAHGIEAEIELVTPNDLDAAFDRLGRGDVHYRFVIDFNT